MSYLEKDSLINKVVLNGKETIGQIPKEAISKMLKSVDFIPMIEDIHDMIEYTHKVDKASKSTK